MSRERFIKAGGVLKVGEAKPIFLIIYLFTLPDLALRGPLTRGSGVPAGWLAAWLAGPAALGWGSPYPTYIWLTFCQTGTFGSHSARRGPYPRHVWLTFCQTWDVQGCVSVGHTEAGKIWWRVFRRDFLKGNVEKLFSEVPEL